MTSPTRVLFNTLEQVLSTDLNRLGQLAGAAVQDALLALVGGMNAATTPRTVVRRGLDCAVGAGTSVDIAAGELIQYDAAAVPNQSRYKLGSLAASQNVAGLVADGLLPRIYRISASVGSVDSDSSVRNVLTLPSRTVVPTSIFKTRSPNLTLTATAGTPAANPVAPATPAGQVALWDVYVPAAAISIDPNHLIDLRQPMNPSGISLEHGRREGLFVGIGAASGNVRVCSGRALVDGAPLTVGFDFSDALANVTESGAAPAPDQEWHVYAIARGASPMGRTVAGGVVFVASLTTPGLTGAPSAPIAFNALSGFVGPASAPAYSTDKALYLGTVVTDPVGATEFGGNGLSLNKDGQATAAWGSAADGRIPGFLGRRSGWLRRPKLTWTSSSSVTLSAGIPVIDGAPHARDPNPSAVASFAGNLVSGDLETASTWYYVYARKMLATATVARGVSQSYVLRISSEAPNSNLAKPTPEAGFASNDYLYCGSFYNDAGGGGGGDIREFRQVGDRHLWNEQLLIAALGAPALDPARTAFTLNLPATSRVGVVQLEAQAGPTAAGLFLKTVQVFAPAGQTNRIGNLRGFLIASGAGDGQANTSVYDLQVDGSLQFEANYTAGTGTGIMQVEVNQLGYLESIETL